jgi:hypothetical protein
MDVDRCIEAYVKLSKDIFCPARRPVGFRWGKDVLYTQERFDSAALEWAVKGILIEEGLHEDALLRDDSKKCKVSVA